MVSISLLNGITEYRERLQTMGIEKLVRESFLAAVRKFMEMDKLTKLLLRELIDKLEVYETEGVGKNRTQRVVIYYRFVGYFEIPYVRHVPAELATRQGVANRYLPELPAYKKTQTKKQIRNSIRTCFQANFAKCGIKKSSVHNANPL